MKILISVLVGLLILIVIIIKLTLPPSTEESLLNLGYVYDGEDYVYKIDDDTNSQIRVDGSGEYSFITLESDNASINLDDDGSVYCDENLGGDCDDAQNHTGIFDKGQQIYVLLVNLHDNENANEIYLETTDLLGYDISKITEIVDLTAEIIDDEATTDEATTDEATTDEATTDEATTDEVTTESVTSNSIFGTSALKKAQSYVNMSGFSESGLQKQLEFEGFADDEIQYALDNVDVDYNQESLEKAQSYIDMSGFSKTGLQKQLQYENFTTDQIQYALDNVNVDYNQEALEKAQSYLSMSSFSSDRLQQQLSYEGFSSTEIQYAMSNVQ